MAIAVAVAELATGQQAFLLCAVMNINSHYLYHYRHLTPTDGCLCFITGKNNCKNE